MRAYRLILRVPGALAFSASGLLARFPTAMLGIGSVLMVQSLYSSYGLAGSIAAAEVLCQAIAAPLLARMVDRYGQRRVMLPCLNACALALTVLVILTTRQVAPIYLFPPAMLSGATMGSPGALVRARWARVLDEQERLHTAYSLESALDEVCYVVGPVLTTWLATAVDAAAGVVVATALLLAGAWLFLSQRRTEPPVLARRPRGGRVGRGRAAIGVLGLPGVALSVAVLLFIGASFGAWDVTIVAVMTELGERDRTGLVMAVFASGSLLGGLAYGARTWRSPLIKRYVIGVVAMGAGYLAFLLSRSLWELAALCFATGFAIAPTLINVNAMIQRLVPQAVLTEGLTWIAVSINLGVAAGSPLAGELIDRWGGQVGFLVTAGVGVAAIAVALASWRPLARHLAEAGES